MMMDLPFVCYPVFQVNIHWGNTLKLVLLHVEVVRSIPYKMPIAQWEFVWPNLDLPNNEAKSEVSA